MPREQESETGEPRAAPLMGALFGYGSDERLLSRADSLHNLGSVAHCHRSRIPSQGCHSEVCLLDFKRAASLHILVADGFQLPPEPALGVHTCFVLLGPNQFPTGESRSSTSIRRAA